MEIHSDNVNTLDEWAAVLFRAVHSSSLNELKGKKADPEEGLAEQRACGFEQWSYLVKKHKCIQCCPIYNCKK